MAEASLIRRLRGAGHRATVARRAVIRVLEEHRAHMSAEDIYAQLARSGARIDLSSVYRTLALLMRLGLVRSAGPADRHNHFEMKHEARVHFACAGCGRVIETQLPRRAEIEHAVRSAALGEGFAMSGFTIEASGHCDACRHVDEIDHVRGAGDLGGE